MEDFVSKYLKILKGKKDGLTSKEFLELLGVELIPKELYENELFIRKKLEEIWSNSNKKELILQRYKKLNPRMDETRLDNYRAAKTLEEFLDNYGNESIGYNQALGKWLKAPKSNIPSLPSQ